MRRRKFIGLICGTAASIAWPLDVRAQQPERVRRVAALDLLAENDPVGRAQIAAFRKRIAELGWVEGRNIRIDERWAGGDLERAGKYAQELVSLSPDVILARSSVMVPVHKSTSTIPIVFIGGADPVAEGFVTSLARPGGNITGFSNNSPAMATKRLQLLREIAPTVASLGYVYDSTQSGTAQFLAELETAVSFIGVRLTPMNVRDASDIERTVELFAREPNGGLFVYAGGATNAHRELIVALARRYRMPAIYGYRYFVTIGGLMSYGVDAADQYRRAASYVDRILKGEKPSDLPVQQPTRLELTVNLKTANELGLTVPAALLGTADEVIE